MPFIDLSIEERGYAPASIAIAVRTIGGCPDMCHRPDARILCGIGLLRVVPDAHEGYYFSADARCLGEGNIPLDLLDWLEPHVPDIGAVVSWNNFGSVPHRFVALADAVRHPNIIAAASDTAGRWRDMRHANAWHLRQSPASHMPCLCGPAISVDKCDAVLPAELLPNPITTSRELISEAIAGWRCWASSLGDFDDADHPAQAALRALDRLRAHHSATR